MGKKNLIWNRWKLLKIDKIQHSFLIKTISKGGIDGKFFHKIKGIPEKSIANIIFLYTTHGEKPKEFPGGSVVKNSPTSAEDGGLIPGPERSHGDGNGNPLQYSCLWNPMDRGVWHVTVPWDPKRDGHNLATKQQSQRHKTHVHTEFYL